MQGWPAIEVGKIVLQGFGYCGFEPGFEAVGVVPGGQDFFGVEFVRGRRRSGHGVGVVHVEDNALFAVAVRFDNIDAIVV